MIFRRFTENGRYPMPVRAHGLTGCSSPFGGFCSCLIPLFRCPSGRHDSALGILTWMNGLKVVRSGASSQDGVPVGMTFFMGSVMVLAGAGDVRMLLRGGVLGAKRIARHLWRMCLALFIATGPFSWTLEPPIEIALGSEARATPVPGSIQHDVVFNSQHTPTDYADLLASPSALHECIHGIETTRIRKS